MGSRDVKLAESVGIIFNTRIVRGKADGKSGQVSNKKNRSFHEESPETYDS